MHRGKYEATTWPAGNYRAEIDAAEETTSKTSGKPMLKMKLRLEDPELGENVIFAYIVQGQTKRFEQLALALGWPADTEDFDPAKIEGKSVEVAIGIESKPGFDDRNTITAWLEKSPARPAPAATQNRAPLATDRARQQVRANDPPKPAPKTSRAAVADDDIPF